MFQGTLFIISAPSGAGKSSLIDALLKSSQDDDRLRLSVSHTTRAPRLGEVHGKDYFFVSTEEFERLIADNAFLEYAEVFGNYYGTAVATITSFLENGMDVFLDIDWQGARQVRSKFSTARSIFIIPPSYAALENRLKERGKDSSSTINHRMERAVNEISHYNEYDYLIINEDFDNALNDLKIIVQAERLTRIRQQNKYQNLLATLLAE